MKLTTRSAASVGGLDSPLQSGPNNVPQANPILQEVRRRGFHARLRLTCSIQALFASTVCQPLVYGPRKLSVLLFYRRLFRGRIFDIVSWLMVVLVSIWTVAFFLANLLVCVPINPVIAFSGSSVPQCYNSRNSYIVQTLFDSFFDLAILLLPLPISKSLCLVVYEAF